MVEGRLTKGFTHIKGLRYQSPDTLTQLLETLTDAVILYLKQQVASGADALMLFDSWGGMLTLPDYLTFSLANMARIVSEDYGVPVITFTKGGNAWLAQQRTLPCAGLGIDWTLPLQEARQIIGLEKTLQGNFDPLMLFGDPKLFPSLVAQTLKGMRHDPRLILNLGHGILPKTPIEHVHAWFEALHAFYDAPMASSAI